MSNTEETSTTSFAPHPTSVKVHPLVLLSVVDHYNRVAKDTNNRVVGVLLGSYDRRMGTVEVTNSFGVPFEEDSKDPNIWFLDHNFVDNMFGMYRRVAVREVVIGWYSTGPKIKPSDINIHNQIFSKYISQPVYVIVDVKLQHSTGTIPTEAYYSVEEAEDEKSQPKLTFAHVESEIAAQEAEEIGVEHLLRDVKDTTISDLNSSVSTRLSSLHAFRSKLKEIYDYLNQVENSKLPVCFYFFGLISLIVLSADQSSNNVPITRCFQSFTWTSTT